MKRNLSFAKSVRALAVVSLLYLFPSRSEAHCDGLDGPVVKAARESLNDGKLEHVLIGCGKAMSRKFARRLTMCGRFGNLGKKRGNWRTAISSRRLFAFIVPAKTRLIRVSNQPGRSCPKRFYSRTRLWNLETFHRCWRN